MRQRKVWVVCVCHTQQNNEAHTNESERIFVLCRVKSPIAAAPSPAPAEEQAAMPPAATGAAAAAPPTEPYTFNISGTSLGGDLKTFARAPSCTAR